MRIAAIQTETIVGNVEANLSGCEKLVNQAAREGAEWILLPEFFTTGMGFIPKLAECVLAPDGAATALLLGLAKRHGVNVGGSFLCRDDDGHVRNAFFLATPQGIAGRHNKDLPTMWENCFYVGGDDDGLIRVGDLDVGVALCLEYNRTQTVRRLRGKVDLVVGGSCKWGAPKAVPMHGYPQRHIERFTHWAPPFARMMGCPVVDANHCGDFRCPTPLVGVPYISKYQGGSIICDARGEVLAYRHRDEGAGVVVADIEPGRTEPLEPPPDRFWILELDPVSEYFGWRMQRWHGKHWYKRHGAGAQRAH
ncbi:MAG: carbon-nitrogen hydrolase family protein [Pseudomonadota bacterium]